MNRIWFASAACVLLAANAVQAKDPSPAEIRQLVQKLQGDDADQRLEAAFALARYGAELDTVMPLLTAALSHDRPRMRARAAEVLAQFPPAAKPAAPRLREILRSDDIVEARAAAGYALARMGLDVDTVVPTLLDIVQVHRQADIHNSMALIHTGNALATYGPAAVPAFRTALKSDGRRAAAVQVLGHLGEAGEALVPEIVQLLKEGEIDGSPGGRLLARHGRPAAARVVALLKSEDAVADRAMAALCEFGEEAVAPLALALQDDRAGVRHRAGSVLYYQCYHNRLSVKPELVGAVTPGLARLAGDADAEVRRKAVVSLCRLGDPGAPEVLRALRDRDIRLRLAVIEALNYLSTSQIPETVRLPLTQCLNDPDPLVRVEAVDVLRSIDPNSPRIVPVLLAGLWDNRGDVRYRALVITYHMRDDDAQFASAALAHLRWFDPDRRVRRLAQRMMRKMEEEGRQ